MSFAVNFNIAMLSSVVLASSIGWAANTAPTVAPAAPTATKTSIYVDMTTLVTALQPSIEMLPHDDYVWNWFNASGRDAVWTGQLSASDSAGWSHFSREIKSYWQTFCAGDKTVDPQDCDPSIDISFGQNNMYGPGLYAAVDPVATAMFGKGAGWTLMQMKLPKGYRVFNFDQNTPEGAARASVAESSDIQNTLNAMDCGALANSGYSLLILAMQMSNPGQNSLSAKCKLNIRHLYKDIFKIDAIHYAYVGQAYNVCQNGQNAYRVGAFVLANPSSISANDVRVFNTLTTDDVPDRLRIQSLFYLAYSDFSTGPNAQSTFLQNFFAAKQYPSFPGYQFNGVQKAYDDSGKLVGAGVILCSSTTGSCEVVEETLPPIPTIPQYPLKIDSANFPQNFEPMQQPTNSILWKDLDGQMNDPQLLNWMPQNLIGCETAPSFVPAQ